MSDASNAIGRDPDWAAFMTRLEAAEEEFARGRPTDFKALWSHTGDVTLSGGLGGAIELGWAKVAERLDWASSNYADGVRSRQEFSGLVEEDYAGTGTAGASSTGTQTRKPMRGHHGDWRREEAPTTDCC
jgi:hypothetical protein